jgi:uncharacterized membrane protein YhaH (DUF805 family)
MVGNGMYELSMWHVILGLVLVVVFLWLTARVLAKAGYSGWWCLILLVPLVNIIMVWVFAFSSWPRLKDQPAAGGGGSDAGGGGSGSVVS